MLLRRALRTRALGMAPTNAENARPLYSGGASVNRTLPCARRPPAAHRASRSRAMTVAVRPRRRLPPAAAHRPREGMDPQETNRGFSNAVARLDLVPPFAKALQSVNASVTAAAVSAPSRSRRAIADAHSTSVAHHTSIAGSVPARSCNAFVAASVRSSGTMAGRPRISSALPPFVQKGTNAGGALLRTRRWAGDHCVGRHAARRAHEAVANQPCQPVVFFEPMLVTGSRRATGRPRSAR